MENGIANGTAVSAPSVALAEKERNANMHVIPLDEKRRKVDSLARNVKALEMSMDAVGQGFGYTLAEHKVMQLSGSITWTFVRPTGDAVKFRCNADCGPLMAIRDCIENFLRSYDDESQIA